MVFEWGRFSDKQLHSIKYSNRRINIWEGSVRSGKTIASIIRWFGYIKHSKYDKFLMVGKTERTLKRNILDVIKDMCGSQFHYNSGIGEGRLFNKTIYIAGANDERSQEKIRGMTLAGAYCDEVSLYPDSFFKMLLSRLSLPKAKLFGTTNPDSPYHWLKTEYLDRVNELDLISFKFKLDDNLTLDPIYVENLKNEYTGVWYQRFIEGQWVLAEGLVYDMFNEKQHVVDIPEDRKFKNYFFATDYGTNNPCVFLVIGYDDYKDTFYVVDEYYWDGRNNKQKTDTEYRQDFINFATSFTTKITNYVDPSALSFITELKKYGINVVQAKNDVLDGIRFISSLLGLNKIKINKKCQNLIKEFHSYCWDAKAQQKGEDKPIKDNDHALDALRYGLFTRFGEMQLTKPFGMSR